MTSKLPVRVEIALPAVKKLKRLRKKYPQVYNDIQGLISQLENGQTPGDQISGVKYTVYKVQVRNTDVPKGKSGGHRVIYYLRTLDHTILISIYSKSEQTVIEANEIQRIINDLKSPPA